MRQQKDNAPSTVNGTTAPQPGQSAGRHNKCTAAECAELARVSVSLVYAWCRSGALKHYRLGRPGKRGKIVIEQADFERFLQAMQVSNNQMGESRLKFL